MLPLIALAAVFIAGCRAASSNPNNSPTGSPNADAASDGATDSAPDAEQGKKYVDIAPSVPKSIFCNSNAVAPAKSGEFRKMHLSEVGLDKSIVPIGAFHPTGGSFVFYQPGHDNPAGVTATLQLTPLTKKLDKYKLVLHHCGIEGKENPKFVCWPDSFFTSKESNVAWEKLYFMDHDCDGIGDLVMTMSDGFATVFYDWTSKSPLAPRPISKPDF